MNRKRILKTSIAIAITIAILSYLLYIYFEPPGEESLHIKCFTKTVFNLNCMSCGLTRFVYFAMHGDWQTAFRYNIFGPFLLLALAIIYFYYMRWSLFDKYFPEIPLWTVWAFLAFFIIYSILRNIPLKVFQVLVPPS